MSLVELYKQTPVNRHQEIAIDNAGHVFFDGKEYVLTGEGELKLIRDDAPAVAKLDALVTKTGATVITKG